MTPEKFADSQQQEAWRAYACAALEGILSQPGMGDCHSSLINTTAAGFADSMMAEEMKRR